MSTIKLGIFGSGGKMGKEILALANQNMRFETSVGVDRHFRPSSCRHTVRDLQSAEALVADLWIEFSSPAAFDQILEFAVKNKKPLISGTTGLRPEQFQSLKKAGEVIPVLWASNMSLGIAVLNQAIRLFSQLEGFDFQIEEIHHNRKKDNPSGTALTLQETLQQSVRSQVPAPFGIRGGGVFGVHKVWAFSDEEQLAFEHQALNRSVFARGALRAVEWLSTQGPGYYGIEDVLLKEKK